MHPLGKVSTQWSPNLAYAVGLLATDGNLSKDGRHIDFTSKDRELIETLKRCLGLSVKIGRKGSGLAKTKKYYRVQFGDVLFYRWLLSIGLCPKKSKTLGPLQIPDKYFFDFLRGSFDGDGSIYAYWDPRWHSSYMFYISFISASPPHLLWLQGRIERLARAVGRITPTRGAFILRYAKQGSLRLYRKMYYADIIPYLARKQKKIARILETNSAHDSRN